MFGPEVGLVGLALNLAFAAVWRRGYSRSRAIKAVAMTQPYIRSLIGGETEAVDFSAFYASLAAAGAGC
jgi:hypothetical protein